MMPKRHKNTEVSWLSKTKTKPYLNFSSNDFQYLTLLVNLGQQTSSSVNPVLAQEKATVEQKVRCLTAQLGLLRRSLRTKAVKLLPIVHKTIV